MICSAQPFWSCVVGCTFKSTKKLNHDILDSLDKPIVPRHCMFPLANLHSTESLYCVPESNPLNQLILLCICSDNPQPVSAVLYFKSLLFLSFEDRHYVGVILLQY